MRVRAARPAGRMTGVGFAGAPGRGHEFAFAVRERAVGGAAGSRQYAVRTIRRGRRNEDRFRSSEVTWVSFSDAPGSRPGRGGRGHDQAVLGGVGVWNGRAGYTFAAQALDAGEPGRGRDLFAITVWNKAGGVVAELTATIDGGNIQSR
ncbi:MAG: hypothetical protein GEU82_18755 [Luteitalea sp.]|nr:hypothetical protein [Luteitalea sp.]